MKLKFLKVKFVFLAILGMAFFSCQDEIIIVDKPGDNLYPDNYYIAQDAVSNVLNIPLDGPLEYDVNIPNSISFEDLVGINDDVATLGRVLFYDKQLSKNEKVSCASCHQQEKAFADDVALSEGFAGERTDRNSLSLGSFVSIKQHYDEGGINPVIPSFFWDERAATMKDQMIETIANNKEMGMQMYEVAERLQSGENSYYRSLFDKAFGDIEINEERILLAIETFMNSIVSVNSKFDHEVAQNQNGFEVQDFQDFSDAENRGMKIFTENCTTCHSATLGTTNSIFIGGPNINFGADLSKANSGLDLIYEDKGIGAITKRAADNGKFKIPQLRNIALTGPYMHDGRFETLEDVIDFYSEGIQNHANLDDRLKESNGEARHFNFSDEDKAALKSFLETLTDEIFIVEERYSDPFK